jgi:hypothetical protein
MRLFLFFNLLALIFSFNTKLMIKVPTKTKLIFYDNIRNITGDNNTTSVRLRRPVPPIAPKNYVLFDI